MALKVHGLAAHAERDYNEWGVSGSLRLVPGVAGRGLSASLTPSYGADPGGSERLWTMPDASGLAANDNAPLSSRLDAEVGYWVLGYVNGFIAAFGGDRVVGFRDGEVGSMVVTICTERPHESLVSAATAAAILAGD